MFWPLPQPGARRDVATERLSEAMPKLRAYPETGESDRAGLCFPAGFPQESQDYIVLV